MTHRNRTPAAKKLVADIDAWNADVLERISDLGQRVRSEILADPHGARTLAKHWFKTYESIREAWAVASEASPDALSEVEPE